MVGGGSMQVVFHVAKSADVVSFKGVELEIRISSGFFQMCLIVLP